ncbi:hypothetical protein AAFF_G00082840 [Aldrovandia affinis]|uniref:Uncharacterized protein n=1 Tax=Aldrovandia affinis TaxID=143900 RepID=A0AAD7RX18_9TELE|nr:hypothetical protein AAFF_G00082840 [Aldrovandia affinis]
MTLYGEPTAAPCGHFCSKIHAAVTPLPSQTCGGAGSRRGSKAIAERTPALKMAMTQHFNGKVRLGRYSPFLNRRTGLYE